VGAQGQKVSAGGVLRGLEGIMIGAQSSGNPDQATMETLHKVNVESPSETITLHAEACLRKMELTNPRQDVTFSSYPFKLSILMPAFNAEATIMQAIDEVLETDYPCPIELIVVDDGSTDRTWVLLSGIDDSRVIKHRHTANCGGGKALLSAASLATGSHVLPFAADLEYSAADIPKIVAPVLAGRCNVVYGTRLSGCNTVYQSYRHAIGNRLVTRLANMLFDASISDLHTCLKLIPSALLKELTLSESGFGLGAEITGLLLRRGVRPFEVSVSYYGRPRAQGKKVYLRDAITCVRILLRGRFWSRPSTSKRSHENDRPYDIASAVLDQAALSDTC
jgi:glycosyltransferase involved in cell wall biosynthesis